MMRLRQLAFVAAELRPIEHELIEALDLEVCYRDPGLDVFGLRHGLYAVGDRLLEVVSPKVAGTTAGRYLDRRGGDGGYMVIVQVDDLQQHRDRLADTDIRTVFEAKNSGIEGIHLHPADVGGAILSIDQADPPESWAWAGNDWPYHATSGVVADFTGADIQAEDPAAVAARWALALDRTVTSDLTIELDDATIRFVPAVDGRGDGLTAVDFVAEDRSRVGEEVALCGVTCRLV